MSSLSMVLTFLSWTPENQLLCLPHLAVDSGSKNFSFDRDNPIVKLARIIDDLYYQREGESLKEWQHRLDITDECDLEKLTATIEGLHVVFYLMRSASMDHLFTKHGIKGSTVWKFIRSLANDGRRILNKADEPTPDIVRTFIQSYRLNE